MTYECPAGFHAGLATKPICGVLAVAIAAKVSYDVAHATLKSCMSPYQKRFGGRTYHKQRIQALFLLGVKFTEQYVQSGRKLTVAEFAQRVAKPDTIYILTFRGHTFTMRNNHVIDQTLNCHYLLSGIDRKQLLNWLEILE